MKYTLATVNAIYFLVAGCVHLLEQLGYFMHLTKFMSQTLT